MNQIIAIGYDAEGPSYQRAKTLAEQLNLQIDNDVLPRLEVTADKLVLRLEHFSPLFVDFGNAMWQKRREAGKKQGLVRACKPVNGMKVIDATAGWGRDAAVLASFGAEVLMLERQPVMAALLADGLQRMITQGAANLSLSLLPIDAKQYLQALEKDDYPDVIYIDPMHPTRSKSALVKKDMQALQQLIGADHDAQDLIKLAVSRVRQRVVVKWPQHASSLLPPNLSVNGKTVRFDIYFPQGNPSLRAERSNP